MRVRRFFGFVLGGGCVHGCGLADFNSFWGQGVYFESVCKLRKWLIPFHAKFGDYAGII